MRLEKDSFNVPDDTHGNFYRHVDGGCYQVISRGRDTESEAEWVAYIHRFPNDVTWSFRTAENFDSMTDGHRRFTPISVAEAQAMMAEDRAVARERVAANRAARRATRTTPPAPRP